MREKRGKEGMMTGREKSDRQDAENPKQTGTTLTSGRPRALRVSISARLASE